MGDTCVVLFDYFGYLIDKFIYSDSHELFVKLVLGDGSRWRHETGPQAVKDSKLKWRGLLFDNKIRQYQLYDEDISIRVMDKNGQDGAERLLCKADVIGSSLLDTTNVWIELSGDLLGNDDGSISGRYVLRSRFRLNSEVVAANDVEYDSDEEREKDRIAAEEAIMAAAAAAKEEEERRAAEEAEELAKMKEDEEREAQEKHLGEAAAEGAVVEEATVSVAQHSVTFAQDDIVGVEPEFGCLDVSELKLSNMRCSGKYSVLHFNPHKFLHANCTLALLPAELLEGDLLFVQLVVGQGDMWSHETVHIPHEGVAATWKELEFSGKLPSCDITDYGVYLQVKVKNDSVDKCIGMASVDAHSLLGEVNSWVELTGSLEDEDTGSSTGGEYLIKARFRTKEIDSTEQGEKDDAVSVASKTSKPPPTPTKDDISRASENSPRFGQNGQWSEIQDADGNVYYYHLETGETSWTKPGEETGESPDVDVVRHGDWIQHQDENGNFYWYNEVSGASAWELPSDEPEEYHMHDATDHSRGHHPAAYASASAGGYTIEL